MKNIILFPLLSFFCNCHPTAVSFKELNIDEIRYSYQDASVPPPFHRSYTLTINDSSLQVVVDSYGTIISDSIFPCTKAQFEHVIHLLDSGKVRNTKVKENVGCTGGNGESIYCYSNKKVVFSGNVDHCGGKDFGNLKGELFPAAEAALKLIPDFDSLLKRGVMPE